MWNLKKEINKAHEFVELNCMVFHTFEPLKKAQPMRKYINSGLFTVVILLFFLPFMEVRCNDQEIVHASGMAMALNLKFETNEDLFGGMGGMMKDNNEMQSALDKNNRKPDVFGIITLFLMVIGIAFQFVPSLSKPWISALIGGIALIALLLMYFIYTKGWEDKLNSGGVEMLGYMRFTLHFVYGYWLALLGCIGLLAYNIFNQIQDNRAKALEVYYPITKEDSPDIIDNF
jgi:hypothetical protein